MGKTTTAAALALSLADAGERVLVLSVDPAHSLGDALGIPLRGEPAPVPGAPGLEAMEVDALRERHRFLGTRRGLLLRLIERGTYLERADAEDFVDLALPGTDELAALFRLMELAAGDDRRLVIDTAPTGHTLRLLDLPRVAREWLAALEAMEQKHRALALALAGAYRPDEAAGLLEELAADLHRLDALLRDPARTRFVLVTTPEPVVLAETRRYRADLEARGLGLAGIVVNRSRPGADRAAPSRGMLFVPPLDSVPAGLSGLRRFAAAAALAPRPPLPPAGEGAERVAGSAGLRVGVPFRPPLDRGLYVVGGKGGVGKSTAACALAVRLARKGSRGVLLLGADPAGSLGDVLGLDVGPDPRPVPGTEGLRVQQLDAPAAWAAFRDEVREETERLFAGLLSGGRSAAYDQYVVQRLIDVAPPGVDELVALLEVLDALEDRPYDALVLDSAPTGHLLRLLELPGLALEWTHALLRLLLRYREAVRLGDLAERVLSLSRSLRALREGLADPRRTWFLAVALPEALSVPETERLIARLGALGIRPGALLVNRALDARARVEPGAAESVRALASLGAGSAVLAAPRLERGPVSPPELLGFIGSWRRLNPG